MTAQHEAAPVVPTAAEIEAVYEEACAAAGDDKHDFWNRIDETARRRYASDAALSRRRQREQAQRLGFPSIDEYLQAMDALFPPPPLRLVDDVQDLLAEPPDGAELVGERDPLPSLRSVASMARPDDLDVEPVEGLIRRRALHVLATVEGLGKTHMSAEIAIRCSLGVGAVFGRYQVREAIRVAIIDEENGEAQLWRVEETILGAVGVERASLTGLARVSFAGLHLGRPDRQRWLLDELRRERPELVILDTGGAMVDDEWGAGLKDGIRFLREIIRDHGCSILVLVHLTKPGRDRARGDGDRLHGSALSDVMGQWTRHADVVITALDLGADRVRLAVRKRIEPSTVILARADGLWVHVAEADAQGSRASIDDRILRALASGAEAADEIREALGTDGRALAKRTFYDGLRRLRLAGFVADGIPLRLTDSGSEAVA